jgi:hypothetical protein
MFSLFSGWVKIQLVTFCSLRCGKVAVLVIVVDYGLEKGWCVVLLLGFWLNWDYMKRKGIFKSFSIFSRWDFCGFFEP